MGAKLIRDKVPDGPWLDEGAKRFIRVVTDADELLGLTMAKFFEEIGEVFSATGEKERIEELADLYATFESLVVRGGYTMDEVMVAHHAKLETHGGFTKGLVWDRHKYLGE